MNIHQYSILILDFGSQYVQLIARRIRELGVYCEIYPFDVKAQEIKKFNPSGIILSGGPETVTLKKTPRAPKIVFTLGCPVLGICYGMQTMAMQLGGKVAASKQCEFGYAHIKPNINSKLLVGIKDFDVWMSHGDQVTKLPSGFKSIAATANTSLAAMANEEKYFYGLQFHPEVTHTKEGKRILVNFVYDICQCKKLWTSANIIETKTKEIVEQVGDESLILGLSGGVDSSVVALLLHKAIGKQLTCILVDTGFMRLNEADLAVKLFRKHFGIKVIRINAKKEFLAALKGITNPEQKRKIIGKKFIKIFEQAAKKRKGIRWLAQGTIYPDVVESAQNKFGKAEVIKSHHNVGGLPKKMRLKLIEPLRELFKDEVREIGIKLGLPSDIIFQHPFPGPGLAVRILGEVKQKYIAILRKADYLFIEELRAANLHNKVNQAFAVFLPVKSVGVKGDARKYDYVIALRAVETTDFMTADWAHLPHEFLNEIATKIANEIPGISRVVYDISSKPPATIEWE